MKIEIKHENIVKEIYPRDMKNGEYARVTYWGGTDFYIGDILTRRHNNWFMISNDESANIIWTEKQLQESVKVVVVNHLTITAS